MSSEHEISALVAWYFSKWPSGVFSSASMLRAFFRSVASYVELQEVEMWKVVLCFWNLDIILLFWRYLKNKIWDSLLNHCNQDSNTVFVIHKVYLRRVLNFQNIHLIGEAGIKGKQVKHSSSLYCECRAVHNPQSWCSGQESSTVSVPPEYSLNR